MGVFTSYEMRKGVKQNKKSVFIWFHVSNLKKLKYLFLKVFQLPLQRVIKF
jgi:hypothetical protein